MRVAVETTIEVFGIALVVAGVCWNWGLGWGAIVAGVSIVGVSVWRNVR